MDPTERNKIQVTIFGPNLSAAAQRKGEMHIHATGCADCKHYGPGRKFGGDYEINPWTIDAASRAEVVIEIYPPDQFDYDPETDLDAYDDLYVAPCVRWAS